MSSTLKEVEELRRLLHERDRQLQEERQRRQEDNKKREEDNKKREEDNKKREEAESALNANLAANRPLSLQEVLRLWHTLYADPDTYTTSVPITFGQFTSPECRVYPENLHPWLDFERLHRQAWDELVRMINQAQNAAFHSRSQYVTEAEGFMSEVFLRHENHLVAYLSRTLEERVVNVFKRIDSPIVFQDLKSNPLADLNNRMENMTVKDRPATPPNGRQFDKLCSIMEPQGQRSVMVVEYKAAHKLTEATLADLDTTRSYDIRGIIHRHKISTQKEEARRENAENILAIIVTQTYDYMVSQGVCYGYITGGRFFVFLYFDPEKPSTAFYHCQRVEVGLFDNAPEENDLGRKTAIGLIAAFAQLAASRGTEQTPEWIKRQHNMLPVWAVDDATITNGLTPSPAPAIKESPGYPGPAHVSVSPSDRILRSRTRMKSRTGCKDDQKDEKADSGDEKDPDGDQPTMYCQSSPSKVKDREVSHEPRSNDQRSSNRNKTQNAYCTQRCLLGLVRGYKLDPRCPNVEEHRCPNVEEYRLKEENQFHLIAFGEFQRLITNQLNTIPRDEGFRSLDRTGWAGTCLWVRLLSHGYTFVAKGTVKVLVTVIRQEAQFYQQMEILQGKAIPVYLGSMNLRRGYFLCHGVYIEHLMLLSWGGEEAWRCELDAVQLRRETARTVAEVRRLGVNQGDLREPNILWNEERKRVMMIDFEFAKQLPKTGSGQKRMILGDSEKSEKKSTALGESSGNVGRDNRLGKFEVKLQSERVKELKPGEKEEAEQDLEMTHVQEQTSDKGYY